MIMKLNLQRFAGEIGSTIFEFDDGIESLSYNGTNIQNNSAVSLFTSIGTFTLNFVLKNGYVIDKITFSQEDLSATNITNSSFDAIATSSGGGGTCSITTKKATSQLSVDLATYDIADGTHTIKLKAKAKGYKSSDLSSGVEYVKSSASSETWVLNDIITDILSKTSISFMSNEKNFFGILVADELGLEISYFTNSNLTLSRTVYSSGWGANTVYRTITFSTAPTDELLTWLQANGTKQSASTFVQVSVTRTSANRSQISVSKDKIYSVQTKNMPFGSSQEGITYFKYENGWTSVFGTADQIGITSSTDTSIVFTGYSGSTTGDTTFYGWGDVIVLEGSKEAIESDFNDFTSENNASSWACIIEDTLITLANGETKKVQDITYNDELLVWNFYEGKLDVAKPCWIKKVEIASEYNLCKFSNGSEVGFVGEGGNIGYHRIYNDELKQFTHTGVEETPNGTHTFAQDGTMPTLVSQEVIKKNVKFYNIITDKHYNLFANGILTSCKLSNKYAIKDMKYYGNLLISNEEEKAYFEKKWLKGVKQ